MSAATQPNTPKKEKWKEVVDSFCRKIPTASAWRQMQISVGLNTAKDYEHAIKFLTSQSSRGLTKVENVGLSKAIHNFRAFIFYSYCEVLEKRGVSQNTIDNIRQSITSSKRYQQNRIQRGAASINKHLIPELVKCGWSIYRATELILINPLSLSAIGFIRNDGSFAFILDHLGRKEYVEHDFSDCLEPGYTIPSLIASLADTPSTGNAAINLSIQEVCEALGYDLNTVPKSTDRMHKVRPAAKLGSGSFLNFQVLVPDPSTRGGISIASDFHVASNIEDSLCLFGGNSIFAEPNPVRAEALESPEKFILPLFYAMGGMIPKFCLDRATSLRQRYSECGEVVEVGPNNARLFPGLKNLFSDKKGLEQSIDRLSSCSVIAEEVIDGVETYVCRCEPARNLYDRNRAFWIGQAFELCCYIFPCSPIIDRSFNDVGRSLQSILQHLLHRFKESDVEIPTGDDVVETLLAASKFGSLSIRQRLLAAAARLQSHSVSTCLQADILHQQSILLRLSGDISSSKNAIRGFLHRASFKPTPRSHFLLGLLHLSQANNQTYCFDFPKAHEETRRCQLSDKMLSEMQFDVLWGQIYCNGRILRGEGLFEEARYCFEGCLAAVQLPKSKRYLITSNLADLYCELDYLEHKRESEQATIQSMTYLDKAEEIARREIKHIRAHGGYLKGHRRLLLSLAEVQIKQNRREEAENSVKELLNIYNRMPEPDIIDRLGHVRALIAWARISPPSEAEARWTAALHQNKVYNPLEEEVFTCGVVRLFISSARLRLGEVAGSLAALNRAEQILGRRKPQFLIPGIGTYLFDSVRYELHFDSRLAAIRDEHMILSF